METTREMRQMKHLQRRGSSCNSGMKIQVFSDEDFAMLPGKRTEMKG